MGEGNGTPLQYSCVENPMDAAAFSSYDGDLSLPLGLALGSPIFPSGCLPRQPFCFSAFLFHGDGLDPCLLYNVRNLSP